MTNDELKDKIKRLTKKLITILASFEAGFYYESIKNELILHLNEILGLLQ